MPTPFDYDTFTARNLGHVDASTQAKIRDSRILIAGCGIGSSVAVCAARMGFERFVLVDGDTVDLHNLNRQFYDAADIGQPKVLALKDKLLRINPHTEVEAVVSYLNPGNVDVVVAGADIVFDTIDFLDLEAILALHASAKQHRRAVFTALTVGFGGGVLYFPAAFALSLADIVAQDMPDGVMPSYASVFAGVMQRIAGTLDAEVVREVGKALTMMEDGKPCPASQVAVGSFTVAALAVSMMHDMLAGREVPSAPHMLIHSFRNHQTRLANLAGQPA